MNKIDQMKYTRDGFLCLFKDNYLYEIQEKNGFNIESLEIMMFYIHNFLQDGIYPENYKQQLFEQLSRLRTVTTGDVERRIKLINYSITSINGDIESKEYFTKCVKKLLKEALADLKSNEKKLSVGFYVKTNLALIFGEVKINFNASNPSELRNEVADVIKNISQGCECMRDTKFAYNMVKRFYGFLSGLYPTGYEIYEKHMLDTCGKVVTATPENLKSIIEDLVLIKSAERSILETHFEPGYFEQKWQELIAFSSSNEYYTALRNILTSPDFEVNETFKQNAIEVVSLNNNKRAKRLLGRKIYKQFNQKG